MYLSGFFPRSGSAAASSGAAARPSALGFVIHRQQGSTIDDPSISAIEGVLWSGAVASIGDCDGDGTLLKLRESFGGTIDWGDGTSSLLSASIPEGRGVYCSHVWAETGTYTVTVSANDPDGGSSQITETATASDGQLSWYPDLSATGLPPGLTIGGSSGLISGTISSTADTNSPYSVTVTAKDSNNDSVSQTFNWTVARVSLNPINDQENQEGTSVSLQLSASDNEGTPTYSATGLPPGLSISSGGLISGTVGIGSFGNSPYQVTATATDGTATSSQSFVWTVSPRVALVNPGPQANATGDTVSLQLSATSPGGTITYSASGLPAGLSINASTGLISGSPTIANITPYSVTATANDGTSSSSQTFAWTISAINLVSPGDQTNNDGDTVSLSLTTGYHGSGTLSYSATGLPTGLAINTSTGQITGTISGTADTNSPYSVTVTVTDGTNTSSQTFNWTVNQVVSIDAIADQSNADGDSVSLQVTASDSENKTLGYSATGLPTGLAINSSGLIYGTIANGAETGSPYSVTVTVSDGSGNSATASFTWTVTHVYLANPGSQSSLDGAVVSLPLQGHDADGDRVSYTASGLPSGLSINTGTGLISGTIAANADASSPYPVTVTAGDGTNTTTQTFTWTVGQVILTAPSNQTNTEGDNVSLQLQASASSGTLSYNASGLPNGLSLNTTTGLITGTIAAGDAANGPYTVDVSASNGTASTSQTFTWTVNPVVNLTTPADQNNNEGDNVSLQISATDSLGKTLSYSADGLPAGLSINSSGLISGSISSGDAADGPYTVTVTAGDGTYSSSADFTWYVTHTDTTPLTMNNPGTQVNVTGDNVSLQINASDPDGIDTLFYSATGLPDGLDIDPFSGLLSGTVADDAVSSTPYSVTVTANDGNGQSISQTFSWLIHAAILNDPASPINAVEGLDTGTLTLATFSTADLNSEPGDFTATVTWGDGASDLGTLSGGNGSFAVSDDHTYAEKGIYSVTILISNTITGASTTETTTSTVADAGLTITGGFQLGDPETNNQLNFTLATFTDADPNAAASDFSVTVDWGDGNQYTGNYAVSEGNGVFLIVAPHRYAIPLQDSKEWLYPVTITVNDVDGSSASVTDTVVQDNIVADIQATMTGWMFVDQSTVATADDFVAQGQKGVALVNWGDGTSSLGTVSYDGAYPSGGTQFSVTAWHTYLQDSYDQPGGKYMITMTLTDDDGNTLTGTQHVSVDRPPMTAYSAVLPDSTTLSNVAVAAFTVDDLIDGPSEYSAQIVWGDGTSSSGTVQQVVPGSFVVLGSHTFTTTVAQPVIVYISQGWTTMAIAAVAVDAKTAPVKLYSVTYSGPNGYTLVHDDSIDYYGTPQWLDKDLDGKIGAGDNEFPYAYLSGKQMNIQAVFVPKWTAGKMPSSILVQGKVITTLPKSDPINIAKTPLNLKMTWFIPNYQLNTSITLPSYTADIKNFTIVWEYSVNGGSAWLPAGRSDNHIYLTYKALAKKKTGINNLQTIFQDATSPTPFDDKGAPIDLINKVIWPHFSSLNATRALDGASLTYYKEWNTTAVFYWNLVNDLDGPCGAWCALLSVVFRADGLDSVLGWNYYIDDFRPKPQYKYNGLLVNKWIFQGAAPYKNYYKEGIFGENDYNWSNDPKAPQVTYDTSKESKSLLGQGKVKYPKALFPDHCVVEVDPPQQGKVFQVLLYDPSYGKVYQATGASLEEARNSAIFSFQKAAIAGFYKEEPAMGNTPAYLQITQNDNKANYLEASKRDIIGDVLNS